MNIKSPLEAYWEIDNFLKIQAGKITEKLDEEKINKLDIYLSLKNNFKFKNSPNDRIAKIISSYSINSIPVGMSIETMIQDASFLNTLISWFYSFSSIYFNCEECVDGKKKKDILSNVGLINMYTRLPNFTIGLTFLLKPMIEYVSNKSTENLIGDLVYGSFMFSNGLGQYIRHSDEDGLKEKRKRKLEKELENAVRA